MIWGTQYFVIILPTLTEYSWQSCEAKLGDVAMRCEYCGDEFVGVRLHQRFCTIACGQHYFAWERREAVKAFRGAAQTYHEREAETLGPGGRFAALEPRLTDAELPAPVWAPDPTGVEPPADRREDGPRINGFPLHEEWEP